MRSIRLAVCCAAVFAMLAFTLPVSANTITKSVDLLVPAKVGRTQLTVGNYKIHIDGNKVTVKQGKKIIAETTGEFVEREKKQSNNSVIVGPDGALEEVRFAGDKRVLVLAR